MAKVYLESTDTAFTVSNSNTTVYGASGTQTVTIASDVTGVKYDATTERVVFSGASSAYTYAQSGNVMIVYLGTTLVAMIPVQTNTEDLGGDGTRLTFTDGTVNATLASGVMSVGGKTVTGTATANYTTGTATNALPAAVTSPVIDATLFSPATTAPTTPTVGQAYTLTTGSDISGVLIGSAGTTSIDGNDTFAATGSTLTTNDVVNGGNGTDVLNLSISSNFTNTPTVVSIETVNVSASSATDLTISTDNIVGIGTTINLVNAMAGGATGFVVNNIASGATIAAGSGTTGTLDLDQAGATLTVTAGSATTVAVGDTDETTVSGTSITAVNVEGTTDSADSLTLSAAGSVALNTNSDGAGTDQVEYLTLSGNGASATYTLNASDAIEKVTFTGSQAVTLVGAATDFTTETFIDSTTSATTTLKINDDATSDFSNATVDYIEVANGTTGGVVYTVKNSQQVKVSTALTGAGTVAFDSTELSSGSETLNINVYSSQAGSSFTVSDFETVNLDTTNSTTTSSSAVTFVNLVGSTSSGSVINISGDEDLTLTDATATKIVATSLSGVLTATIAADLNNITGGSGNDSIIAIDTSFTVDGGTGTDTLTMDATIDLSDNTISISNIETIQLDSGSNGTENLTVKATAVTGKTFVLKGGAANADTLIIKADTATIDLSGISVDTASAEVSINLTDTAGVVNTISGSQGKDTLTNAGGGNITVDGKSGGDALVTSSGIDSITGGEGADTITSGAGADTITLTETTAAVDVVVQTGGAATTDTLIGFTVGSSGDNIDLDFSDIEALATDLVLVADATSAATTDANVISTVTASFDAASLTASTAIVALNGTIASASALEDALETGGTFAMTANNAWAVGDIGLFLYTDGTDTYLAAVETAAGIANDAKAAASDLTANVLIKFSGISSVTSFVDANFDIIA